jgi:hypothetical protein
VKTREFGLKQKNYPRRLQKYLPVRLQYKLQYLKPKVIRYVGIEPGQEYWRLLYHWDEKAVYLKTTTGTYINFKGYLLLVSYLEKPISLVKSYMKTMLLNWLCMYPKHKCGKKSTVINIFTQMSI